MNKKKAGALLLALGAVLVAVSAAMVYSHIRASAEAEDASRRTMESIREILEETLPPEETNVTASSGPTGPSEPDTLETFELRGDDYVGYLSIPAYELELPVMHQISEERLKVAPCLEAGAFYDDNAVICGHNYRSQFLALHTIQPGEKVSFTYANGFRAEYTVTACRVIDPTDLDSVLRSGHDLVLYTCTSDGEKRYAVYCDRASSDPA